MIAPLSEFVIRPGSSRLRVFIRIYRTRTEMLKAMREDVVGGIANSTLACTVHLTKSLMHEPNVGSVVFFSKLHCTRDIVAHELVHVAANILERRGRKGLSWEDEKGEEELAGLVESLMREFYKHQLP